MEGKDVRRLDGGGGGRGGGVVVVVVVAVAMYCAVHWHGESAI